MTVLLSKLRLLSVALAVSAGVTAPHTAFAHGGGFVPVHGSPSMSGGGLVTHGNLKLPPPPINIVRDHRSGGYYHRCPYAPGSCAPGGIIGGTPVDPPYGGLPQGAPAAVRIVRSRRRVGSCQGFPCCRSSFRFTTRKITLNR
jgi:hypothetical protein